MKKLVMGSKKVFAAFMMAVMMVCTVAPLVRAGYHITKSGSRGKDAEEYYSITTVAAYSDNGDAMEVIVGAQMPGTGWTYVTGIGRVTVSSATSKFPGDARHAYGVDGKIIGEWVQN